MEDDPLAVLQIAEARRADPLTSRAEVYLRIRKSHPKPWRSRNKMNCVCIIAEVATPATVLKKEVCCTGRA